MRRWITAAGLVALLIALPLLFSAGSSFAWFTYEAAIVDNAQVGRLQVDISYEADVSGGETGFVAANTGSLACYVRIGCSFVYHGADGNELLKDVSGLELSGTLTASGGEVFGAVERLTSEAGGFAHERDFVLALDGDGAYYRLAPGETLTGAYAVGGVSLGEGQSLQVSWVAEAIQCNEAALRDAREYGWDPRLA